jgi:cytoskeletal protein CcmA (bactofilin family)
MMFKTKSADAVPSQPGLKNAAAPTVISADMTIQGDLKSAGDLQVEGIVIGDIEAGRLVIAEGGKVNGNVAAQNVRICGALNGAVRSAMVTLTATARVLGDVHHELLSIETGGQLEGQSRRIATGPTPAPLSPFSSITPPALYDLHSFAAATYEASDVWE